MQRSILARDSMCKASFRELENPVDVIEKVVRQSQEAVTMILSPAFTLNFSAALP